MGDLLDDGHGDIWQQRFGSNPTRDDRLGVSDQICIVSNNGIDPLIITAIFAIFTDFASNRTPGWRFDPNLFCHLSAHASGVRSPGAGGIGPVVSTRPRFFLRLVLRFDYLRSTSYISIQHPKFSKLIKNYIYTPHKLHIYPLFETQISKFSKITYIYPFTYNYTHTPL